MKQIGNSLIDLNNIIECEPISSNYNVTMSLTFNSGQKFTELFSRKDAFKIMLFFDVKNNPDKYNFKILNYGEKI